MPVTKGRGWSQATIDKEDGLGKIIKLHSKIVSHILEKHKWAPNCYYYIDAYAGSGINPEVDCLGSPLVFIDAMLDFFLPIKAWFIDIEPENTAQLQCILKENPWYNICTGDNSVVVPKIAASLPPSAYGLMYADATNLPNFDLLSEISKIKKLSKFDILIRYSATMIKRTKHVTGKDMREFLRMINKKEWLIRDVLSGDRYQWTFLLGTNWTDFPAWEKQRFHKADSENGQRIFNMCQKTRSELSAL